MKYCTKCQVEKPFTDFYKVKYKSGNVGIQTHCKSCNNKALVQRRWAVRDWLSALKERPCTDCGIQYPPCIMQWDHLPGTDKIWEVGGAYTKSHNRKKILEEIAKCELVCANCHGLRTHNRRTINLVVD